MEKKAMMRILGLVLLLVSAVAMAACEPVPGLATPEPGTVPTPTAVSGGSMSVNDDGSKNENDAANENDDSSGRNEFEGVVEAVSGSMLVVGGRSFTLPAGFVLSDDIVEGATIRVRASDDGAVIEIELLEASDNSNANEDDDSNSNGDDSNENDDDSNTNTGVNDNGSNDNGDDDGSNTNGDDDGSNTNGDDDGSNDNGDDDSSGSNDNGDDDHNDND
ncbi:MAG: hypothetical protein Kow00124_20180 [Anaerolineae bacterium]